MGERKMEQPGKHNEIDNRPLKETLADTALSLLSQGEDYTDLADTSCEFGYLFGFDGHGLEALFKITTDRGEHYFTAQGQSLKHLNIDDVAFQEISRKFLELHG